MVFGPNIFGGYEFPMCLPPYLDLLAQIPLRDISNLEPIG